MIRSWECTQWVDHYDAMPGEPMKTLVCDKDERELARVIEVQGEGYLLLQNGSTGDDVPYLYPELTRLLHTTHFKFGLPSNFIVLSQVIDGLDYIVCMKMISSLTNFMLFTKEGDAIRITFSIRSGVIAEKFQHVIIKFPIASCRSTDRHLDEICTEIEQRFIEKTWNFAHFEDFQFTYL